MTTSVAKSPVWVPETTFVACVGSAAAAVVHLGLAPEHLGESLVLGLGFVAAAAAQAASALHGARFAVPLNLALVALWLVSRTTGLPFIAEAEPVGVLDGLTVALELAVVGLASGLAAARRPALVLSAAAVCVLVSGMGTH